MPLPHGGGGISSAGIDAAFPTAVRGDILRRNVALWDRYALGLNGTILSSNGTDVVYQTAAALGLATSLQTAYGLGASIAVTATNPVVIQNTTTVSSKLLQLNELKTAGTANYGLNWTRAVAASGTYTGGAINIQNTPVMAAGVLELGTLVNINHAPTVAAGTSDVTVGLAINIGPTISSSQTRGATITMASNNLNDATNYCPGLLVTHYGTGHCIDMQFSGTAESNQTMFIAEMGSSSASGTASQTSAASGGIFGCVLRRQGIFNGTMTLSNPYITVLSQPKSASGKTLTLSASLFDVQHTPSLNSGTITDSSVGVSVAMTPANSGTPFCIGQKITMTAPAANTVMIGLQFSGNSNFQGSYINWATGGSTSATHITGPTDINLLINSGATNSKSIVLNTTTTIGPTTLADSVTSNFLNVTGTLPGGAWAAAHAGVNLVITTTAGQTANNPYGLYLQLNAGMTAARLTCGFLVQNFVSGTGTGNFYNSASGNTAGNIGGYIQTSGTTTGINGGFVGYAASGSSNYGVVGRTDGNDANINVGVAGVSLANGGTMLGGYFQLGTATPTLTSAALMCDNGAQAIPIFIARDNGTVVLSIYDGGGIGQETATTTPGIYRLSQKGGTAITTGDVGTFTATWGASATCSAVSGNDSRGTITITTNAADTPSANPVLTLTFKDGTWTTAPFATACMVSSSTGPLAAVSITTTATTLVIKYIGTPTATSALTYIFSYRVTG